MPITASCHSVAGRPPLRHFPAEFPGAVSVVFWKTSPCFGHCLVPLDFTSSLFIAEQRCSEKLDREAPGRRGLHVSLGVNPGEPGATSSWSALSSPVGRRPGPGQLGATKSCSAHAARGLCFHEIARGLERPVQVTGCIRGDASPPRFPPGRERCAKRGCAGCSRGLQDAAGPLSPHEVSGVPAAEVDGF